MLLVDILVLYLERIIFVPTLDVFDQNGGECRHRP